MPELHPVRSVSEHKPPRGYRALFWRPWWGGFRGRRSWSRGSFSPRPESAAARIRYLLAASRTSGGSNRAKRPKAQPQLISDQKLRISPLSPWRRYTDGFRMQLQWGPFLYLSFCRGPFLHGFWSSEKNKKKTLTDFRRKNDENFGLCLFIRPLGKTSPYLPLWTIWHRDLGVNYV